MPRLTPKPSPVQPEGGVLNPELVFYPVCTEGYSRDDLYMYYAETYLAIRTPEGYEPVFVHTAVSRSKFLVYRMQDSQNITQAEVNIDELFRFFPLFGFYGTENSILKVYTHVGSHKKGLARRNLRVFELRTSGSDGEPVNDAVQVLRRLRYLLYLVQPGERKGGSRHQILSRRICVLNRTLCTFFNTFSVGYQEKSGEVFTPFEAIVDRVNHDNVGGVHCQLLEKK